MQALRKVPGLLQASSLDASAKTLIALARGQMSEVRGQQKQRVMDSVFIANERKPTFCSSVFPL